MSVRIAPLMTAVVTIALGCSSAPDDVGIYAGLYDEDPTRVQDQTVIFGESRDIGSIPHLIHNLDHDERWIRLQTHIAILKLTQNKVDIPYLYEWPQSQRRKSQAAWLEWYEREGRSLADTLAEPRAEDAAAPAPSSGTPEGQ